MDARTAILLTLLLTCISCTEGLREGEEAIRSAVAPSPNGSPRSDSVTPSPSGATGSSALGRHRVELERPQPDGEVLSPVLIRGTAVSASGQVMVRILDAAGMEIAAMNVEVSCGADCRGAFEAQLAFYVTSAQAGTILASEVPVDPGEGGSDAVSVRLIPGV